MGWWNEQLQEAMAYLRREVLARRTGRRIIAMCDRSANRPSRYGSGRGEAATARAEDAELVTGDGDLRGLPGVTFVPKSRKGRDDRLKSS